MCIRRNVQRLYRKTEEIMQESACRIIFILLYRKCDAEVYIVIPYFFFFRNAYTCNVMFGLML